MRKLIHTGDLGHPHSIACCFPGGQPGLTSVRVTVGADNVAARHSDEFRFLIEQAWERRFSISKCCCQTRVNCLVWFGRKSAPVKLCRSCGLRKPDRGSKVQRVVEFSRFATYFWDFSAAAGWWSVSGSPSGMIQSLLHKPVKRPYREFPKRKQQFLRTAVLPAVLN